MGKLTRSGLVAVLLSGCAGDAGTGDDSRFSKHDESYSIALSAARSAESDTCYLGATLIEAKPEAHFAEGYVLDVPESAEVMVEDADTPAELYNSVMKTAALSTPRDDPELDGKGTWVHNFYSPASKTERLIVVNEGQVSFSRAVPSEAPPPSACITAAEWIDSDALFRVAQTIQRDKGLERTSPHAIDWQQLAKEAHLAVTFLSLKGEKFWETSLLKGDTRASRVPGSGPKIWEYGGIKVGAAGAIIDPGLICGVGFECMK